MISLAPDLLKSLIIFWLIFIASKLKKTTAKNTAAMSQKYLHYSTFYDKELLRKSLLCLNEHQMDYQLLNVVDQVHARAPLSSYFEAELHIREDEFERADELLKALLEEEE